MTPAIRQLSLVFDSGPAPPPAADAAGTRAPSLSVRGEGAGPKAVELKISADCAWTPIFVRHPRARRYVLRVMDERTVRVTLPRWGSKREASAFLDRERSWIEKQRRCLMDALSRHFDTVGPVSAPVDVRLPPPNLLIQARTDLPARVHRLAADHGLTVSRITVRNQRSRWGSCSRDGHICLNWRLVTMPDWVRDYVIIHELMHLKCMDHSRRFWKLVAAACPEFECARRYLRDHSIR